MTYGFRSISSGGFVQIDDSFSNFTLLQSGVATGSFLNISYPSSPVQVFGMIKIPIGAFFDVRNGARINVSGGNFGTQIPYDYRIYARNQDFPASINQGIKVFNSSGQTIFDSGVLKVQADAVAYGTFSGFSNSIVIPSVGYHPWIAVCGASGDTGVAQNPPSLSLIIGVAAQQNANFSVNFTTIVVGAIPFGVTIGTFQPLTKPLILGR